MKKQQIQQPTKYPSYSLLPWEDDEVVDYAKRSREKFEHIVDERGDQERILNARLGIGGEIAFKNLLTKEKQLFIIDHASEREEYASPYDFKVKGSDREYTIDVKTTLKSERVPVPDKCNFLWSKKAERIKFERHIPLCDIYVQMFYDPDEFLYYFIGAISLEKIKSVGFGVRISEDLRLINRNEMDYTETFLSYIDKLHKLEVRLI